MLTTIILGSEVDVPYAEKIAGELKNFDVPSQIIVASAHKVPELVVKVIDKLNADPQPQVVIAVVGMSNGLAGVMAGSCIHPIITCPPYENIDEYLVDVHSCLRMPSDVPVMTVLNYKNAALSAARIFAEGNPALQQKIRDRIAKVKSKYAA